MVKEKNTGFNMATWNVRGFGRKLRIGIDFIERLNVKNFGLSEILCSKSIDFDMKSSVENIDVVHIWKK